MAPKDAILLIDRLVYSAKHSQAVWIRGGKGTAALREQTRAATEVFKAIVGREPTKEELAEFPNYLGAS